MLRRSKNAGEGMEGMEVLDPIAVFMKDHDEALTHFQRLK